MRPRDDDAVVVPGADAPWLPIWEFALTYDGYNRAGGFDKAGDLANRAADDWRNDGSLPPDLHAARIALFFEQRRWRHFGYDPGPDDERYIRALVATIGELSGGTVPGPPDLLP
jgi:hypothetical protein